MTVPLLNEGNPEDTDAADEHVYAVVARAAAVWRRAGVRAEDRLALAAELDGELAGARADGQPLSTVLGEDPDTTARAWAVERGLSGRSLRLGLLVPLALAGVLLGSAVFLADLAVAATSTGYSPPHAAVAVTVLASTAVMSVLLPVLVCWAALHAGRDPSAGATARWLLAALPVGGLAALALGVVTAVTAQDSRAVTVLITVVVLGTLAAAVAVARHLAVRYSS